MRREVLYLWRFRRSGRSARTARVQLSGLSLRRSALRRRCPLQPLLREAREQLAGAKDSWLKAASGRAENLPKLKQTLASVHAKAAEIHNGALMKLTAALVERIDKVPAAGVSESVAMEYATALLLAESAFENTQALGPFPEAVDAVVASGCQRAGGRRRVGRADEEK